MDTIKPGKKVLKKFGLSLGIVLLLVTLLISRKAPQKIWLTFFLSLVSYITALLKPSLFGPVYLIMTRIGLILTWLISRLALLIIFYFLFTPMGLVIKLFRVDPLDRKVDKHKESYWKEKEKSALGLPGYERQF